MEFSPESMQIMEKFKNYRGTKGKGRNRQIKKGPMKPQLRMTDVWNHPTRRKVIDLITSRPGVSHREIMQELTGKTINNGTYATILLNLEIHGFIKSMMDGNERVYFRKKVQNPEQYFRNPYARANRLLENLPGGMLRNDLARLLGVSSGTLNKILKENEDLVRVSKLEANGNLTELRPQNRIIYHRSYLDSNSWANVRINVKASV